ncbi:MAG: hypothetical protein ACPKQO_11390 [Nitrososphaeraceae archaeon]
MKRSRLCHRTVNEIINNNIKIDIIDNSENLKIKKFLEYIQNNDSPEHHQNNNLKAIL